MEMQLPKQNGIQRPPLGLEITLKYKWIQMVYFICIIREINRSDDAILLVCFRILHLKRFIPNGGIPAAYVHIY
jgi:hypothetical protein